jgi:hypothetical protein
MNVKELGRILAGCLADAAIAVPERSLLYRPATAIRDMSGAYLSDGEVFLRKGDAVNALACFCYGLGWLDAGCGLGLISMPRQGCRYRDWAVSPVSADLTDHLCEKTTRYDRLLQTALASVEPAPERESPLFLTAGRVHLIGTIYASGGRLHQENGDLSRALALFSYGHGWLDAGVRTGLFRIASHREIFAL